MSIWKELAPKATVVILLALVVLVAAVAVRWVFLVPIYQAPDEPYHLDYALAIYQNRGLFRVQGAPPPGTPMVHPYTHFLMDRTATKALAFHADVKVPPGYGTPAFYEMLAIECPSAESVPIREATGLAWVYPYGYYALLAGWISLLACFSNNVLVLFFGARILSVALLLISMLCIFGTAREMGFSRATGLLLTGIVGLFPMTLFVASYIQPDNLGFTLVSLCFYLTLVARRRTHCTWVLASLGLALGALLVTKGHYYLCTAVPALALLGSLLTRAGVRGRIKAAILLMAPSLACGFLYLWTTWGATNYYSARAAHENLVLFVVDGLRKVLQDFYNGTTHRSFWGVFGWMDTPLVIGNRLTSAVAHALLRLGTWTVLVLTLVRLKQVLTRMFGWFCCGKWQLAVRVLVANPVLNSFFLFTVLMIFLYIRLANRFGAQGRNWLPYLLPIFLTGVWYAPKALRRPHHRAAVSSVILGSLALYGVAGNYYAFQTLRRRYYDPRNDQPMKQVHLPVAEAEATPFVPSPEDNDGSFQKFALKKAVYVYAIRIRYALSPPASDTVRFQWFWRRGTGQVPISYQQSVDPLPGPLEKTLYVWVNETIDQWGIRVAGAEGELILKEAVLYQRPTEPPAEALPVSGCHSASRPGLVQWRDEP
jgi:hypothetical protein